MKPMTLRDIEFFVILSFTQTYFLQITMASCKSIHLPQTFSSYLQKVKNCFPDDLKHIFVYIPPSKYVLRYLSQF